MDKDNGKTSDEVLEEISEKKSLILRDFLRLMQEAAVDCRFNNRDNILSNPELSKLKCFTENPSLNKDDPFNFNLTPNHSVVKGMTAESALIDETQKVNVHPLELKNSTGKRLIVRYITILP